MPPFGSSPGAAPRILTIGPPLLAGQAHRARELGLAVGLEDAQRLQDLLLVPHRTRERAAPPLAVVVHAHVGLAHAAACEFAVGGQMGFGVLGVDLCF